MLNRRSIGWPITLGVVMILLLVALTIGWVVVIVVAANRTTSTGYWWATLAVGATFLALVLIGVIFYLVLAVKEIRLNQRQSNFIDSVTHELKSPLASLKLYVQTLSRHSVTEAQQEDFHRFMLEDLERLDSLINHMLDTARLNQAPVAEDEVDVELSEVLRRCAVTACSHYGLSHDTIKLELSPAIVRAQPLDVEIVFRNLIDNALKYSGETPEVTVQCWVAGGGVIVTRVIDNGPGIPLNLRSKIFGRFFRIGSELERKKTGTGLGLFIVRTLVKRLRGKISVRGRGSQKGSVFEVELPGRGAGHSAIGGLMAKERKIMATVDAKHILVVEDERHLAIGIKYNFEAEGYRVTIAPDGPSALKLIQDNPADVQLVILDLMLPGMSGYAVCEQLREDGNDVPILMLSARTLTEDRIRGMNVGADQYLHKPFDLDELMAMVRNLLARRGRVVAQPSRRKVEDEFEFGEAKINFDTFQVTVRGRGLRLTSMEMKVLRYFIEHEGSVISRSELLDNVWGLSGSVTTRTIDQFMSRLRRYFEEDPAQPRHFLSVRGTGYRFISQPEEKAE